MLSNAQWVGEDVSRDDVASGSRLALLDAENSVGGYLIAHLRRLGHEVERFSSYSEFLSALHENRFFDLLLVHEQEELTRRTLFAVCRALSIATILVVPNKQWGQLSPAGSTPSWDDFIDFSGHRADEAAMELEWRIRCLLLKVNGSSTPTRDAVQEWGDYRFFDATQSVRHRGQTVRLTGRQYSFALELFRNVGQVVTRDLLLLRLWGTCPPPKAIRSLNIYATTIRKQLDLRADNGFVLHSVYGMGYQLVSVPSHPVDDE